MAKRKERSAKQAPETSRKELQARIEELSRTNGRLEEKVRQLERASEDLDNLLSSADIATLFLDRQLRIRHFTPASAGLFGCVASDIGRPIGALSWKFSDEALVADAETALERRERIETQVRDLEGRRWYQRRILPYRTRGKAIAGVVLTLVDITDCKPAAARDAEALRRAKEEAERANRAKSRFLAAASHDLRQPLQTMSLLNSVLTQRVGDSDEEMREVVERQADAVAAMRNLLNLFMDLARLDRGAIKPEISAFPVEDLLQKIGQQFGSGASSRHIDLRTVPCSAILQSDPSLLYRIVENLVSNAVRYTGAGRVVVGCRRRGESLRIEVWDTGPGIPDDRLRMIFEEFVQLSNPARQAEKGYGLGLSVARNLAELLELTLEVRSTFGKGSVFSVEVPVAGRSWSAAPAASQESSTRYQGLAGARILLVEDEPVVKDATRTLLEQLGLQVAVAGSGAEALAQLHEPGGQPDLIMADYRLPGDLSGVEMVSNIRTALGRNIPALLVTGDTSPESVGTMLSSGCRILYKPVRGEELVSAMNVLLGSGDAE